MPIRKIHIPSTFSSICWFSSLFALCFLSILYFHPKDISNCTNTLDITTSKSLVTPSKYVFDDTTIDYLLNEAVDNNVSYVQESESDSAVVELSLNLTSSELNSGDEPLIELIGNQNDEMVVEIVEETSPTNEEETVGDEDRDENYDVIPSFDVLSNPPWNCSKEDRIIWLLQKLHEAKIIKSTIRTRNFNEKILAFFNKRGNTNTNTDTNIENCNVRIFLTWISPASLFGKRELLALESMLKAHPNGCVIILSRTMDSKPGRAILQPLMDLNYKILPIAPDFRYLFSNTPAQGWLERLESGDVDPGTVPITQNLSNLLRMVVLYKYGGVYLDTDMIILKSLSSLKNSIGVQSVDDKSRIWRTLNNAALIFDKEHPLVWKFMEEFASTFDGFTWGFNGPYLTTRVVSRSVNDSMFEFNIMSPMAFYPIDWIRIPRLFEKPYKNGTTWAKTKYDEIHSESYGLHLWNKQTRKLTIENDSEMGRLISEHCIICKDVYDS